MSMAKIQNIMFRLNDQTLNRQQFKQIMNAVIVNEAALMHHLNIELSGIDSMTSEDLSILIYCQQNAQKQGVKLTLVGVTLALLAFFELTRTDHFFHIDPI